MDLNLIFLLITSASFGAIIGKILDAFLLTKMSEKYERKKWLREVKLEAFAKLSEEILSLGLKQGNFNNPWKFKSLGSKAFLFIEDETLIDEIKEFIEAVAKLSMGDTGVTIDSSEEFKLKIANGKITGKKELKLGIAVEHLEKRAVSIVLKLREELKKA